MWLDCEIFPCQLKIFDSVKASVRFLQYIKQWFCCTVSWNGDSLLTWERRRWENLKQAPIPRKRWHPVNICNHRYRFPCIIILHTFQPNIAFTSTGGVTQSERRCSPVPLTEYEEVFWSNLIKKMCSLTFDSFTPTSLNGCLSSF